MLYAPFLSFASSSSNRIRPDGTHSILLYKLEHSHIWSDDFPFQWRTIIIFVSVNANELCHSLQIRRNTIKTIKLHERWDCCWKLKTFIPSWEKRKIANANERNAKYGRILTFQVLQIWIYIRHCYATCMCNVDRILLAAPNTQTVIDAMIKTFLIHWSVPIDVMAYVCLRIVCVRSVV